METKIYQGNFTGTLNPADQLVKHNTLTDRYQHVNTREIETVFKDNGFENVGNSFANSRVNEGYQKHMSIWTRDDLKLGSNGDRIQLLLTNSHDGSSAFRLDTGVFRSVCANGLVSGNIDTSVRTRHSKNVLNRIDKMIQHLIERLPNVAANVDTMRNIHLTREQIETLAYKILRARLNHEKPISLMSYTIKRQADVGNDLWTVFNVLQENALRGGFSYYDFEAETFKKTRKLSSIDKTVKLNKDIWNQAIALAA